MCLCVREFECPLQAAPLALLQRESFPPSRAPGSGPEHRCAWAVGDCSGGELDRREVVLGAR